MNLTSKEIIKPITENLLDIRERVAKIEKTYTTKFTNKEKRCIINEKCDIKLAMIKKYQKEKILINAGGTIFETTKNAVMNCKFDNILKDLLKTDSYTPGDLKSPIFVDFESHYFEAILEMMRNFHYNSEVYAKLESLSEHLKYNMIEDYNSATFIEDKKVFRVYEKGFEIDQEGFIENIKLFFKGNELVLKEAGLLENEKNEEIKLDHQIELINYANTNPPYAYGAVNNHYDNNGYEHPYQY